MIDISPHPTIVHRIVRGAWRILAGPEAAILLLASIAIILVLIGAMPSLRPGVFAQAWPDPLSVGTAWEALHPTVTWAFRSLLAFGLLVCLVRLVDNLFPLSLAPGQGEHRVMFLMTMEDQEHETAQDALWRRLRHLLQKEALELGPVRYQDDVAFASAYRELFHRVASSSLYLGVLLLIMALAVLGFAGWVQVGPVLLLGQVHQMALPSEATLQLDALHLVDSTTDGVRVIGAEIVVSLSAQPDELHFLHPHRAIRHHGLWFSWAYDLPAVRISVLDTQGGGMDLYPMVGSRAPGNLQRMAFMGQEEHLLAVPERNLLLRVAQVSDNNGTLTPQIQVLDGREGSVLEERFVDKPVFIAVDDIVVEIVPEQALVPAFRYTPGLMLAGLAGLVILFGSLAWALLPPHRLWLGVTQMEESESWAVMVRVAASDRDKDWFVQLGDRLRAEEIA